MKKFMIVAAALMAWVGARAAQPVAYAPETVHYNVAYRWGFINKIAGHGVVTTSADASGRFAGSLRGESIPWDGRIYSITDTLSAVMSGGGACAEKVVLRNGLYTKPEVGTRADLSDPASYWDTDGKGLLSASADTQEAVTITADMLSLFYYAKSIDFDSLTEGAKINVPITEADGSAGSLAITYGGEQTVNVGDLEIPTYAIVFNYTYRGTPSAYPVNCWISKVGRVPVIISASLAIGHMEMTAILR